MRDRPRISRRSIRATKAYGRSASFCGLLPLPGRSGFSFSPCDFGRVWSLSSGFFAMELDAPQQHQNEQDDDDQAEPAAAVVAGAVEPAAADAAKAAQQRDDQDDQDDDA